MSAVQPSTVCELTVAPLSTSDDSVSASPACAPRTVRSSLRAAATVEAHAVEASLALATGARTFGRTTEASSRPSAQRSQTTVSSLHRHGGDTVCVRRFCLGARPSKSSIQISKFSISFSTLNHIGASHPYALSLRTYTVIRAARPCAHAWSCMCAARLCAHAWSCIRAARLSNACIC